MVILLLTALCGVGQTVKQAAPNPPSPSNAYLLGPGDQITLIGSEPEEILNKPVRIDGSGELKLPLIGRVHASGLTSRELEGEIAKQLKRFVREPQVTLTISDFRSQRVSVIGSVNTPGVQILEGQRTLIEVLSRAGGIRTDAGHTLRLTRKAEHGAIPIPESREDVSGKFSFADLNVNELLSGSNPAHNIEVLPDDVVSVPKGDLVYVMGEVRKPGGFVLRDQGTLSVVHLLSLAEGMTPTAKPTNAKILRGVGLPSRTEIALNLKSILAGQAPDVLVRADDVLFVPHSSKKQIISRAVDTSILIGTGLLIYRP